MMKMKPLCRMRYMKSQLKVAPGRSFRTLGPIIGCAHDYPNHIGLPRGCLNDICQLLDHLKIKWFVQDELHKGQPLKVNFIGCLRPEQEIAAEKMLKEDMGVLSATTAFGKTVIGAWLIWKREVNTLILVHRKQWNEPIRPLRWYD